MGDCLLIIPVVYALIVEIDAFYGMVCSSVPGLQYIGAIAVVGFNDGCFF